MTLTMNRCENHRLQIDRTSSSIAQTRRCTSAGIAAPALASKITTSRWRQVLAIVPKCISDCSVLTRFEPDRWLCLQLKGVIFNVYRTRWAATCCASSRIVTAGRSSGSFLPTSASSSTKASRCVRCRAFETILIKDSAFNTTLSRSYCFNTFYNFLRKWF